MKGLIVLELTCDRQQPTAIQSTLQNKKRRTAPKTLKSYSSTQFLLRSIMLAVLLMVALIGEPTLGFPLIDHLNSTLSALTVKGCGKNILSFDTPDRIVGGTKAKPGEFPWMVSLREKSSLGFEHVCGASILNNRWIITAAHCFESEKVSMYDVIVGLHQLSKETGKYARKHKLVKIIMHEKYDPDTFENDIALMKTRDAIDIDGSDGFVNGVCLPKANQEPKGYATVSGWGHTKSDGDNSDTLKKVQVPLIPREYCNEVYDEDPYDEFDEVVESMICAGEKGKDSCQNDSGGPLIQRSKSNSATLIGVVSHGAGCGLKYYPGVYTKVSHFIGWLEKHTD